MKKTSYRKILFIIIPVFIISVIILTAFFINKSNDRKGVFSVIEKRWIEKNSSETINISITNDLPVFGHIMTYNVDGKTYEMNHTYNSII